MNNNLKTNIQAIPFYVFHYGIFRGLSLGLKFLFNIKVEKTTLKGYKSPIHLRKNTSDIPTFHKVFSFKEYDIKQLDFEPEVVIDAGANIGLFSIFIKNKFPNSKVIAIEPDIENYELMKKNFIEYENIISLNQGLWKNTALLKAHDKFNQGKWAIVVEEVEDIKDSNVEGISVLEVMKQHQLSKIDVLKIDIETSEKFLFEENYEEWLSKVRMIIIEFHDWIVPGTAQPVLKAINESFPKYSFYMKGENAIIVNEEFDVL